MTQLIAVLMTQLYCCITCRPGCTLAPRTAYKLGFTNAPRHQQAAAATGEDGSGDDETNVVACITVATAAAVPQVCDINSLSPDMQCQSQG